MQGQNLLVRILGTKSSFFLLTHLLSRKSFFERKNVILNPKEALLLLGCQVNLASSSLKMETQSHQQYSYIQDFP
jgi:hypothetical protein